MSKKRVKRRKATSTGKHCAFCLSPGGRLKKLKRPCCRDCFTLSDRILSDANEEVQTIRAAEREFSREFQDVAKGWKK